MKKLFLLLALCGLMVACADDKKKDEEKKSTVVDLIDDLYDAIVERDAKAIEELTSKLERLDEDEQKEALEYLEKNPDKASRIRYIVIPEEYLDDNYDTEGGDEYYYEDDDYYYEEDDYYYEDDEYYYDDEEYYYDDEEYYYDDEEYYW